MARGAGVFVLLATLGWAAVGCQGTVLIEPSPTSTTTSNAGGTATTTTSNTGAGGGIATGGSGGATTTTTTSSGTGGSGCGAGEAMCDGACTDIASDPTSCGACGHVCDATHGAPSCKSGACAIDCDPGFDDCNGDADDGCEADLGSDLASCGACGHTCDATHGAASCDDGLCAITCDPGFEDCNGDASDGCEADLQSDVTSCGACGSICGGAHDTPSCVGGACVLACEKGFDDCNGDALDGCETDLSQDPSSCGECGRVCPTAACSGGGCAPEPITPLGQALSIAIEGDDLFWGTLWDLRKETISTLPGSASTTPFYPLTRVYALALDATFVYWSDSNAIFRAPRAGGPRTLVTTGNLLSSYAIALDATHVYWVDSLAGKLMRTTLADGASSPLADTYLETNGIVTDGKDVYVASWSTGWAVTRASVSGGGFVVLAAGNDGIVKGLAMDATDIYWGAFLDHVDYVFRAPRAGGSPTAIWTSTEGRVSNVLVHGAHVYWLAGKKLYRAGLAGEGVLYIGSCAETFPSGVWVATDGASVYCRQASGITRYPL
jgi:sugar lactone lactonase YvrE